MAIHCFADFFQLLRGDLEIFRHPVVDLVTLHDECYKRAV
jgi:hypothetical protein